MGEVSSTELVTYIPSVFNHPDLTSELRTVETVLEKEQRIQLVLLVESVLLLEMASATTAAPALFHTLVPSEPTAW